MLLKKLDSYMQKSEHRLLSYTIHKNYLRIKYVKMKITKFLEENICSNLLDIGLSIFFKLTLKAREIKTKINKWYSIKLKTLLNCKENHPKNPRRQPMNGRKYLQII